MCLPEGTSFTVFGNVPNTSFALDNVEYFENMLVLDSTQLLIYGFLFFDVFALAEITIYSPYCQIALGFGVEYSEHLLKTIITCAKLPYPISSALLTSNSFLKWVDTTIICIF